MALSTSATAWLLDPAIEKIFINKDQTLIILIPVAIIIAFSAKGISLYFAKLIMINVSEEVKKILQTDMLKSFIKADTETIDSKHSGKYISNLNFDVNQITRMLSEAYLKYFQRWSYINRFTFCNVFPKLETIFNSNYYDSTCIYHCKNFRKKNE